MITHVIFAAICRFSRAAARRFRFELILMLLFSAHIYADTIVAAACCHAMPFTCYLWRAAADYYFDYCRYAAIDAMLLICCLFAAAAALFAMSDMLALMPFFIHVFFADFHAAAFVFQITLTPCLFSPRATRAGFHPYPYATCCLQLLMGAPRAPRLCWRHALMSPYAADAATAFR